MSERAANGSRAARLRDPFLRPRFPLFMPAGLLEAGRRESAYLLPVVEDGAGSPFRPCCVCYAESHRRAPGRRRRRAGVRVCVWLWVRCAPSLAYGRTRSSLVAAVSIVHPRTNGLVACRHDRGARRQVHSDQGASVALHHRQRAPVGKGRTVSCHPQ